jgi:transposase
MPNRRISPDLKECALRLWESGWSRSDICTTLSVSQASLYRWAKIFDEFGSVNPPPPPIRGRPRIIGLAALSAIKELYEAHPSTYLDELQWFLAIHHNIAISISALHENLKKADKAASDKPPVPPRRRGLWSMASVLGSVSKSFTQNCI